MVDLSDIPSIEAQQRFAGNLIEYIISKCAGTHLNDDEISLESRPSRDYFIGTLAARRQADETQSTSDEEGRASIRAQMQKVSFLVETKSITYDSRMLIKATGNVYYPLHSLTGKPSKKADIHHTLNEESNNQSNEMALEGKKRWRRTKYNYLWSTMLQNGATESIDFSDVLKHVNSDPDAKQVPSDTWKATLSLQTKEFDENNTLVTIYYNNANVSLKENRKSSFDNTLFDCRLTVELQNFKVTEFCDEYLYENNKQRYYYHFRSANCQAYWSDRGKVFCTRHHSCFEQADIRLGNQLRIWI